MRIPSGLIHAIHKSAGSQGQPKGKDRVLISHSFEGESQEPPVVGGYLDVKVSIFQIQQKKTVHLACLREDLNLKQYLNLNLK